MAKYEWMTEEIVNNVREALDKLGDVNILIDEIVSDMKYCDVNDADEEECDAIIDELSWDMSGSIGDMQCRLEELFGVEL